MDDYIPPYTISNKTVNLISQITEILTKISFNKNISINPKLRKENRVKTIQASPDFDSRHNKNP